MKRFGRLANCGLMLVVTGCASRIEYSPAGVYDKTKAEQIARRFLEEQPAKYAPLQIEITPEKICLTRYRSKGDDIFGRGGREVPSRSTIYRDNIGSVELIYRHQWHMHHWYVARVYDKNGLLFTRAVSRDRTRAMEFLDAVVSLKSPPRAEGASR